MPGERAKVTRARSTKVAPADGDYRALTASQDTTLIIIRRLVTLVTLPTHPLTPLPSPKPRFRATRVNFFLRSASKKSASAQKAVILFPFKRDFYLLSFLSFPLSSPLPLSRFLYFLLLASDFSTRGLTSEYYSAIFLREGGRKRERSNRPEFRGVLSKNDVNSEHVFVENRALINYLDAYFGALRRTISRILTLAREGRVVVILSRHHRQGGLYRVKGTVIEKLL